MAKYLTFLYITLMPIILSGQNQRSISGFVINATTGEALPGATVYNPDSKIGAVTNSYGFYSLKLPPGTQCIECRFVGYSTSLHSIALVRDTTWNFRLNTNTTIADIVISGSVTRESEDLSGLSRHRINLSQIDRLPAFAGEKDIIKSLQYLPGVKAGMENSASFNVRGGSNDQNLILLDGVPVYNVSHVMGFFSIFNNDVIKSADLFKAGIPAKYGGRLSSVLDIITKEGNLYDESGVFSISPVSARISFESPIKRDTGAFIISYRRSFLDIPMRIAQKMSGSPGDEGYFFHDFNGKVNWKFNDNSRVYFSLYFGKDKLFFKDKDDTGKSKGEYSWGNATSVFRWNKVLAKNLFVNFSTYYSQFYNYQLSGRNDGEINSKFTTQSKLIDKSIKADFDFYASKKYKSRFGVNYSNLTFAPNITNIKNTGTDLQTVLPNQTHSNLADLYFENIIQSGLFNLNIGLRNTAYLTNGKNYFYLQPRLSVSYTTLHKFSISATYSQMMQYLHLLTNSSFGMPTDLWVASTPKTKPETSQQVSLGFSFNHNKNYNFEIESYYKTMEGVVSFKEGTTFQSSKSYDWEENITTGIGRAYGIEFMTEKKNGKITGIASYTLAWSNRKFDEINSGKWFPFKYDRRHDLSFLAEYNFSEKYLRKKSISVAFTLQSGNNLSIPDTEIKGIVPDGFEGGYGAEGWQERQTFNHPNNFKMPVFHHLDIGYNIVQKKTSTKSITWSFSVYNIYNRMNPWYYYKEDYKIKKYVLFPFFPSVSFTYKW